MIGRTGIDLAGSVSDVEVFGDEWGFTLYDTAEREIAAFAFRDEREAQIARKMLEAVVTMAVAISPAERIKGRKRKGPARTGPFHSTTSSYSSDYHLLRRFVPRGAPNGLR
jgi:hypothetical protein